MKRLSAIFLLLFPMLAQAQSSSWFSNLGTPNENTATTEVTSSTLKLLGSGVENRRTGESMALACVGKPTQGSNEANCDLIHWVYFLPHGTAAYFTGKSIQIQSEGSDPDNAEIKSTLKQIRKHFKRVKADQNQDWLDSHAKILTSAGLLGMGALLFAGSMGTAAIICGATAGVIYLTIGVHKAMFTLHPATATFDKQTGWDWSTRPQKISSKNFEILRSIY